MVHKKDESYMRNERNSLEFLDSGSNASFALRFATENTFSCNANACEAFKFKLKLYTFYHNSRLM